MSPINFDRGDALRVRIQQGPLPKGCKKIETCVVKAGPRAYKTASLFSFGEEVSDEITKVELRVQTWTAKGTGSGIDFQESENRWHCEGEEVDKLLAFLSGQVANPGKYRRIDSGSVEGSMVRAIETGRAKAADINAVLNALLAKPDALSGVADSSPAALISGAVHFARHTKTLDALDQLLSKSDVIEPDLQKVLSKDWWIFGGRYISKAQRRSLTVLDQIDVPLIRADGVLHILELKAPRCPRLVVPFRNHFIVGQEVNEAVGQVVNYLRSLDEQRDTILNSIGIDCRRAFATVVVGHPRWVDGVEEKVVNETLRSYNAHLSRIEVITYADLVRDSRNAVSIQRSSEFPEPA